MQKSVIDSNIYIDYLRTGKQSDILEGLYRFRIASLYFSSVVIQELLRGALDKKGIQLVQILYAPFKKVGRIITPTDKDWEDAGIILQKIVRKHPSHRNKLPSLLGDTLIALSARRQGAVVYTQNEKDFGLISSVKEISYRVVKSTL